MERAVPGVARVRCARWARAGHATDPDPVAAATRAVRDAVAGRADAALVLLFAPCGPDLDRLVAAATAAAGDVPLAGCAAGQQLTADGAAADAVLAIALGGAGVRASVAAVEGEDPRDAGARAAACIGDVADCEHRLLLLFAADAVADPTEVVRGAYSVAGAGVPLAGGRCGPVDGAVFSGAAALRHAVVGVALGSDAPIGVGVAHGFVPTGEPLLVTHARDGRVLTLDGAPTLEALRGRFGAEVDRHALLRRPLGLPRRTGEAQVRPMLVDERSAQDGSVACAVVEGALLWEMRGDAGSALDATDAACADAIGALHGRAPQLLLAFDCYVRGLVLGPEGTAEELARVRRHAPDAVFAGVRTVGEFARAQGPAGLHHNAFVAVALA